MRLPFSSNNMLDTFVSQWQIRFGSFPSRYRRSAAQISSASFSISSTSDCTFSIRPAASAQDTGKEKISLGDAMPAITLSSEIYGKVTPADLKGKVVLVSLFATWCGPCQIELAEVQKTLWPKYKDNKDFKLLVIGREHTDAELKKYNERKKFSFPLYPDPKREVFSLFADQTIPRAYLFGKDGKLIHASIGYTKSEFQELMADIEAALK